MRIEVAFDPAELEAYEKQQQQDQAALDNINAMIAAGGLAPQAVAPQLAAQVTRDPQDQSTWGHVSRNEPCPCESGKKYKHCHGKLG